MVTSRLAVLAAVCLFLKCRIGNFCGDGNAWTELSDGNEIVAL